MSFNEDKVEFDNNNNIDLNQSALSQVFQTAVFGRLLSCISGYAVLDVPSAAQR